jgi:hypothetical protein
LEQFIEPTEVSDLQIPVGVTNGINVRVDKFLWRQIAVALANQHQQEEPPHLALCIVLFYGQQQQEQTTREKNKMRCTISSPVPSAPCTFEMTMGNLSTCSRASVCT